MKDTITIPRESAEALIKLATRVLDMTEEAIYETDSTHSESAEKNKRRLRVVEDTFSDDKANFIEGRRR